MWRLLFPTTLAAAYMSKLDVLPGYLNAVKQMAERNTTVDVFAATPVGLNTVQLLPGGRGYHALELNRQWLELFDPDRLLYNFRATSNVSIRNATSYGGWEDPSSLLRGHVTGGHWLSGASLVVNATRDEKLSSTVAYVVQELAVCQNANEAAYGLGYLGAWVSCPN